MDPLENWKGFATIHEIDIVASEQNYEKLIAMENSSTALCPCEVNISSVDQKILLPRLNRKSKA